MDNHLERAVLVVHDFVGGGRQIGDALTEIAALATEALDTDMAGLTLNDADGKATTAIFTDRMVPEIDQAQYDVDDGPCLHAFRSAKVVRIDEVASDDRWPLYAEVAAAHGIHSTLSIPVHVAGSGVGALNFYDRRPSRFDQGSAELGKVFAGQVAVISAYFDKADTADHLRVAMESRAEIEQAKGIIMATTGCDPDGAFDVLRQQSQRENRKLRDIAADIVAQQQRRSGS